MGTNGVIDVAIALVLMYLVLSLAVTVVNEQIATAIDLRAATLGTALEALLDDPVLKTEFNAHGLIAGLNDAVKQTSGVFSPLVWLCRKLARMPPPNPDQRISYLSSKTFAQALIGSLDKKKPIPGFNDIKGAVLNLPPSQIKDALLSHLTQANGDIDALRGHIAGWFDAAMDRVNGVYKRDVKRISFIVGVIVVTLFNADTVKVSKALWNDASLRAEMVQSASKMLADHPAGLTSADNKAAAQGESAAAPAQGSESKTTNQGSVNKTSVPGQSDAQTSKPQSLTEAFQTIKSDQETLRPLPIGWSWNPLAAFVSSDTREALRNQLSLFMFASKLVGLLMTALAISLGAPFWFDLLGLFMQIRGTGEKPKKAEPAKT
jgi:hypothetical protein